MSSRSGGSHSSWTDQCCSLSWGSFVLAGDIIATVVLALGAVPFTLYLFIVRVALLLLGGYAGVQCGRGQCGRGATPSGPGRLGGGRGRDLELPLAQEVGSESSQDNLQNAIAIEATQKQSIRKATIIVGFFFLFVTVEAVYTGVQIVNRGAEDAVKAVAMCCEVFCMFLEYLLLSRFVDGMVTQKGEMFPGVHEHPLHFTSESRLAFCSMCREKLGPKTGGYEHWTCKTCGVDTGNQKGAGKGSGFILCLLCYRRSSTSDQVQEGILRGDKGPKPSVDLSAWGYVRRTMKLAASFKFGMASALFCVLMASLAQVLIPNQEGKVIQSLVYMDRSIFAGVLTQFVVTSVIGALFKALQGLSVNLVARQISLGIRSDMFASIIKQDMAFFDGVMTGQLTSRMTNDVQSVTQPIQQTLNTTIANLIKFVGGTFMCFHTSWQLTMLAVTMIGPVIYLTGKYASWSKEINGLVRASIADSNSTATESFRNVRTVRSFGATEVESAVFDSHIVTAKKNMTKDAFANAGIMAISGYINFAAGVFIYWYGGVSVLDGTDGNLNIGTLVVYQMYWEMLSTSINGINNQLNSLIVAASAAKRVYEIIDLQPDIKINDPQALSLEDVVPAGRCPSIEFQDVEFRYQMRPDRMVLCRLSFSVPAGHTVALVGKSGCGKSTTMQLLLRFYDPVSGAILVAGRPLPEYNLRSYQRRVAVVSQETQVFARTVKDNMTYGLREEDFSDASIIDSAQKANAHEFIVKMEHQYETMLGESGSNLSGGQRQRLSIARAFLRKPQLLLLDEATSALDAENEKQIQESLDDMVKAMAGSVSIVMIAHRLSTVMNADTIVVFDEGAVCEQGSHRELMEQDGVYASLVKRQMALAIENAGGAGLEEGWRGRRSDDGDRPGKGKRDRGKDGGWRSGEDHGGGGVWGDDGEEGEKGKGKRWGKGKGKGGGEDGDEGAKGSGKDKGTRWGDDDEEGEKGKGKRWGKGKGKGGGEDGDEGAKGSGKDKGKRWGDDDEEGEKGNGKRRGKGKGWGDDDEEGAKGSGKDKGKGWGDDDEEGAKGKRKGKGKGMGTKSGKEGESEGASWEGKGKAFAKGWQWEETGEGLRQGDRWEWGKGKGRQFWEHFETLAKQSGSEAKRQRKEMLQRRMRHILNRALDSAGVDEVSDTLVEIMRGVIDSELGEVSEASAAEEDGPADSIDRLFREVQRKSAQQSRQ